MWTVGRRFFCRSALLILMGAVIGTVLLTLAYMLPVDVVNKSILMEKLNASWYPRVSEAAFSQDIYFDSYLPDVLDDSTDMLMLSTALDTNEGDPLQRAMNQYNEFSGNYPNYWHGYVSILRPFLLLFDYSEFRIFNGVCQLLLVVFLSLLIGREKGIQYVLMLVSSYVLLGAMALPLSLQYTWVFDIAYVGTLVMMLKRDFFSANGRYVYFFLCMGMCTSYFDLLTYPLLTWGMPLVWWMVMDRTRKKELVRARQVVGSGIGWIAGYAGMWIMKWAFGTVILGRDIFASAVGKVFFRSGLKEKDIYGLWGRMNVLYDNWKHYGYKVYALILGCWLLWWGYRTIRRGFRRNSGRYAYFLIGMSSIVWYFVLANHTQAHHFFTYRIFGVSILAFMAILLESTEGAVKQDGRERLAVLGVWLAVFVLAVPLALLARENRWVHNGDCVSFRQYEMGANGRLETEFSPAFDEVKGLNLGLEFAGTEGRYVITLLDGDGLMYRETFSIADCSGHFQGVDVAWKLDHRKTYRLLIEVEGNEAPVKVWSTEGEMPLTEYGALWVDGAAADGQMLAGITYWCLPASATWVLFLIMTWVGIGICCFYVFLPNKVFEHLFPSAMSRGMHRES